MDSAVDPRFGRAKNLILYDMDTAAFEVVGNEQNLQAAQGAGIQAAQSVANTGAEAVITGHCGPKAFRTLTAADIAVYCDAQGTVAEAVEAYKNGKLVRADQADVEGHW